MWRLVFLIFVLVGALALAIGVIVGVGTIQLARTNAPIDAPATQPVATVEPVPAEAVAAAATIQEIPPPEVVVVAKAVDPAVPVKPQQIVEPIPVGPKAAARGEVKSLVLAKIDGVEPIMSLTDGMTVDLAKLPKKFTVRAQVEGTPQSVRFRHEYRNNSTVHVENAAPWTLNGDGNGKAEPYEFKSGEHAIAVAPYSGLDGDGKMGGYLKLKFRVVDTGSSGPIKLLAAQATLKGQQIRLEGEGDDRAVAFWHTKDDAVSWEGNVGKAGMYRVELTYACDPQLGGGSFVAVINERRFSATPPPTASWQEYRNLELGHVTLREGNLKVHIKPVKIREGKALMNVRSVQLIRAD